MDFSREPTQFETEVTKVVLRNRDAKSVQFRRPKSFGYLPGQWAFVTVGDEKKQKTKPLSFSSCPTESYLEFTKRLTGHEFSNAFASMEVGDRAAIRGPFGDLIPQEDNKKICMLSGGIGITPLRSIIRYSTDMKLTTSIILLYSNRFEDAITFLDDFDEMIARNPNFKMIITVTKPSSTWNGLTGRINSDMIEKNVPDFKDRVFYTSGPKSMVDAMVTMLNGMGLHEKQIKYEYFSGYLGA